MMVTFEYPSRPPKSTTLQGVYAMFNGLEAVNSPSKLQRKATDPAKSQEVSYVYIYTMCIFEGFRGKPQTSLSESILESS